MLLVDSADEPTNKEMLRDSEYLGRLCIYAQSLFYADIATSRRLGATLYGSKGQRIPALIPTPLAIYPHRLRYPGKSLPTRAYSRAKVRCH